MPFQLSQKDQRKCRMRKAFRCIKQTKHKICYVSLGIDNIYPLKLYHIFNNKFEKIIIKKRLNNYPERRNKDDIQWFL